MAIIPPQEDTQDPGLPLAGPATNSSAPAPTASQAAIPATTPAVPVTPPVTPTIQPPAAPVPTPPVTTPSTAAQPLYEDPQNPTFITGYKDPTSGKITYTRGGQTDPSAAAAQTTLTAPKSVADYEKDAYANVYPEYAGAISAINDNYSNLITEAQQKGQQQQGAARAAGALFGLGGSAEQNSAETGVGAATSKNVTALTQARSADIQSTLEKVHAAAKEMATAQANSDQNSAQNVMALKDKATTTATAAVKTLANSGVTLDALKTKSPATYKALLDQTGGDENTLAAMFTLGKPQATVLDTKTVGSTLYQTSKDPVTGAITTSHFDLGFTPPVDYNAPVIDRTNGTVVWTPKNPDPSKPLSDQIITKRYAAGTSSSGGSSATNPLTISRYTLAANRIVNNFIHLPGYKNLSGASGYLQRIESAKAYPGSVGDQELLDAVTQLNTGGNRVTEAQVGLITGGRSLSDFANVLNKKLSSNGGVLSSDQRRQLTNIANEVYGKYQTAYQPIYNQATKQLEDAGIPKAYWTIPDLNSLSTIAGSVNATDAADRSSNTQTQPDEQPQAEDIQSKMDQLSPDQIQELKDEGLYDQ